MPFDRMMGTILCGSVSLLALTGIAMAQPRSTNILIFNQKALADVAEEFNRYNSKRIVVSGAARDIRIGGSFRADSIEVFAQRVRTDLGLKVTEAGGQIEISQ